MTKSTVVTVCYTSAAMCAVSVVAIILVASRMDELASMDDVVLVYGVQGVGVVGLAFLIVGLFADFSDV